MGENLYEIPKGWVWVNLGDIADKLQSGGTPSTKVAEYYKNGNIPFVKIEDITNAGKYLKQTVTSITIAGLQSSSAWLIPSNSLLYTMYASYGIPIINSIEVATSQAIIAVLLPKQLINIDYIYYYLLKIRPELASKTRGTTQKNLNAALIKNFLIPLPPLAEQYRIVAKIEELFTQLDAGVELLKKVKAKLKRYRQAVLKAAVEGNLTKEWRTDHQGELEPASVLLERILKQRREKWEAEQLAKMQAQGKTPKDDSWKLKYKEPIAPDTSDLPELPDGWLWTTLELVANAVDPQPSHRTPPSVDDGIPYIGMGDIKNGRIDFENSRKVSLKVLQEHQERYQLKLGDFIFGKIGTLGKPVKVSPPFCYTLSANVILIQPDINFLNSEFAITYMASTLIETLLKKESRATTQAAFGIQKVRIIPFPFPPLQEQLAIAEELELIFSVTDQLEKTVDTNIKRAEKLRQSILKQAFTGQLVPQDPNDEPAEKLLERIKAEKAKQVTTKSKKKTKSQPKSSAQLALPLE
ncbi:restriction endonuclease subunit S [Nodularia spumigena]|uniref:restriction endonuclease subunit S n=1 Tax=Nodularia spumigena TaxID=70799 RepID=UPI000D305D6B|nr:restriction endonuclease subunit S [Nodularia spumigena]